MSEQFKIFIDRLRGGQTQKIEERFDPAFLGPNEPELCFDRSVQVKGEIYISDAHLVIHLKAQTKISMPCAVCNQMIDVDLKADKFYHLVPLEEIGNAVFDYGELLREALLIELPKRVECNGNCFERAKLKPFLRQEKTYFPFADMDNLKLF